MKFVFLENLKQRFYLEVQNLNFEKFKIKISVKGVKYLVYFSRVKNPSYSHKKFPNHTQNDQNNTSHSLKKHAEIRYIYHDEGKVYENY